MPRKAISKEDNARLDALRMILKTQAVTLDPTFDQVSALPVDSQMEYYFVPIGFMHQYEHYHRPGKPYKNLKLVNYNQPAISLSFYYKHKYMIRREVSVEEIAQHLKDYRTELLNRSLLQQLSASQLRELQQTDEMMRTLRDQPTAYQACFSNYHHYYKYWYCTYRYFEDEAQTLTASSSEHLLKHTERVADKVHERLNIIFIDPSYISKPVPHDNKFIDRELDTYPIRIRQGISTLYLRET